MATKSAVRKVATPQPTPRRAPGGVAKTTTPAEAPSRALATRSPSGGAVAPLGERMAGRGLRQREELAKLPAGGVPALSFKGGTITLDDANLGHEIPIITLASQFERTWYPADYKADVTAFPSCYSHDAGAGAAPHPKSAYPQAKLCAQCPHNEFGSARQGEGKACREGYKFAIVHADQAGKATAPPVVMARFSVLNSKDINKALRGIFSMTDERGAKVVDHTIQVRTILTCNPDNARMLKNELIFDGFNPPEIVEQLEPMIEDCEAMLIEPYPADKAVDPATVSGGKSKGAVGVKTKRRF